MKRYLVEFIGTFFATFTICLVSQPLGIGLMFAAMIYFGGHISGGHYNPAVSLACFLEGSLKLPVFGAYVAAQCVGSFFAAFLFNVLSETTFFPSPAPQILVWEAVLIEALLTFVLCAIVLVLARKKVAASEISLGGMVVGLTIAALIFTGGDISGGVFNPAVGLGTILFDVIKGGDSLPFLSVYLIGPSLGAVIASYVQQFLNSAE